MDKGSGCSGLVFGPIRIFTVPSIEPPDFNCSRVLSHAPYLIPSTWATKSWKEVGIAGGVKAEVGAGVGERVGVGVGVGAGEAVCEALGVGIGAGTLTPLLQTNFFPALMQV